MRLIYRLLFCSLLLAVVASAQSPQFESGLAVMQKGQAVGDCPLQHTSVLAALSGFVARVSVTPRYRNPRAQAIEAVYVFPMPERAAVDGLEIRIGNRRIVGVIKTRQEAHVLFDRARAAGQLASVVDQERPNIFTQAVTNIPPGAIVEVTLTYSEVLKYDAGSYEFVFPMTIGPRYIPGAPTSAGGMTKVPDADKLASPLAPAGTLAGHDVSVNVAIDAGVPIDAVESPSHAIIADRVNAHEFKVALADQAAIPNKDFILRYRVASSSELQEALLTHRDKRGGFFTLILQPPERFADSDVTPKEIVFLLDTSGSMAGFPIEKAKEVVMKALDGLYPGDTFNLITFSGDTQVLFPQPVYPTAENIAKTKAVLAGKSGNGGTEMMKAIQAALAPSESPDHVRIVCFLTDGMVGNDMAIIGEVQKHPNARIFSFGIGSSVNRFLLSEIARRGRGEAEFVGLKDDGDAAAQRFYERVRSPLLTDVSVTWNGVVVSDVTPARVADVFAARPVVITGRYAQPGRGSVTLHATRAGAAYTREIPVDFPADSPGNAVLASFWARGQVDDLMAQNWEGVQQGKPTATIEKAATLLGTQFGIVTQWTSLIAVEDRVVNRDGKPVRVQVPVDAPYGTQFANEVVTHKLGAGNSAAFGRMYQFYSLQKPGNGTSSGGGVGPGKGGGIGGGVYHVGGGVPGGQVGGVVGGTITAVPMVAVPPAAPPATLHKEVQEPAPDPVESKFDRKLVAVVQCAADASKTCTGVKDGRVNVRIFFQGDRDAMLAKLTALGFTSAPGTKTGMLAGSIATDQLHALAKTEGIVFVTATD